MQYPHTIEHFQTHNLKIFGNSFNVEYVLTLAIVGVVH